MQRRQLLKLAGANLLGSAFSQFTFSRTPTQAAPLWDYSGNVSPEHWGDLSPEFQLCRIGQQQTPIDLAEATATETEAIAIHYQSMPLSITNTTRTIQVNAAPGNLLTFRDETFQLLQFHFHHPSEHRLRGQPLDLEMHLVHRSATGKLAVIGVFIAAGAFNALLQPIWEQMPNQPGTVEAKAMINVAQLLPNDRQFYEYRGSLTTPPCSENVLWFVMTQPIELSAAQIQQFAALFPANARPLQVRGDRSIKLIKQ